MSQSRLKQAQEDFKKHVKSLHEMKKDLDYIFKKIRNMKVKLNQQYPQAYSDALPQRPTLAEEAEDDEAMKEETPTSSSLPESNSQEKKDEVTVEYVKMEERPNDSDCTSEETG